MAEGLYRGARKEKKGRKLSDAELEMQQFQKIGKGTAVVATEEAVPPVQENAQIESVPSTAPQRSTEPQIETKATSTPPRREAVRSEHDSLDELRETILNDPTIPPEIKEVTRFKYQAAPSAHGGVDVGVQAPLEFLDYLDDPTSPLAKYRQKYIYLTERLGDTRPYEKSPYSVTYGERDVRAEMQQELREAVAKVEEVQQTTIQPASYENAEDAYLASLPVENSEGVSTTNVEGSAHQASSEAEPEEIVEPPRELETEVSGATNNHQEEAEQSSDQSENPDEDPTTAPHREGAQDGHVEMGEVSPGVWAPRSEGMHQAGGDPSEHLRQRTDDLNREAGNLGVGEKNFFRRIGEGYNKLNWKYKLAVGVGLTVGVGLSTVGSIPAMTMGGLIGAQRLLGLGGVYLKVEKHMQETGEGTRTGFWANKEWYKKLSARPEGQRKAMAAMIAIGYTGVMVFGIHEAIGFIRGDDSWGGQAHDWIKHWWSEHGSHLMPGASTPEVPIASVDASHGHGYEYMTKRLWEQLQSKHLNPNDYSPDSDIHKLLTTDAHHIDKLVHDMASDPKHGFFNPDGTSIRVDPHAHLAIKADGQLHFSDPTHPDIIEVPKDMAAHTTPVYRPEAQVAHTEGVPESDFATTPLDSHGHPITAPGTTIDDAPTFPSHDGAHHVSDSVAPSEHPVAPSAERVDAPEVDIHDPNLLRHAGAYVDKEGTPIILGGSVEERAAKAAELVTKNHAAVAYYDSTDPDSGGFLTRLFSSNKTQLSKAYWANGAARALEDTTEPVMPGVEDIAGVYKPPN